MKVTSKRLHVDGTPRWYMCQVEYYEFVLLKDLLGNLPNEMVVEALGDAYVDGFGTRKGSKSVMELLDHIYMTMVEGF